jgi:hypothetical protein
MPVPRRSGEPFESRVSIYLPIAEEIRSPLSSLLGQKSAIDRRQRVVLEQKVAHCRKLTGVTRQ